MVAGLHQLFSRPCCSAIVGSEGGSNMVWTAILVALAATVTVVAYFRCRKANDLIERILVEELGASAPQPGAPPAITPRVPVQEPTHPRLALDGLLGVDRV